MIINSIIESITRVIINTNVEEVVDEVNNKNDN